MTTPVPSAQDLSTILSQVKGLEEEKTKLMQMLEEERKRLKDAEVRAEKMSEGKRAEMTQALNTVIKKWLQDSVQDPKVQEEFERGMGGLVSSAQEDNGVWQVVCKASELHARNLQTIEEMRNENQQLKTRVYGEFHSDSARGSGGFPGSSSGAGGAGVGGKRGIDQVPADENSWMGFAKTMGTFRDFVPDMSKVQVEMF